MNDRQFFRNTLRMNIILTASLVMNTLGLPRLERNKP